MRRSLIKLLVLGISLGLGACGDSEERHPLKERLDQQTQRANETWRDYQRIKKEVIP